MKNQPECIILASLEVVVMPNGEILCLGHRIGRFKTYQHVLKPISYADGTPIIEEGS